MLIAGVDEVGRGPLAGAVVAAAVILDPKNVIEGLTDSKKLSEKKREVYFDLIHEKALAFAIGRAEVEEIDQLNILQASLLAMKRAVDELSIKPDLVLVDGNKTTDFGIPSKPIIQGDLIEPCISAASILAKVTRDREMQVIDKLYPQYGFAKHKGYPTKLHREALQRYGITPIHRKSYAPVQQILL